MRHKAELFRFFRLCLAGALIFKILGEAGPMTAVAITLLTIAVELLVGLLRMQREEIDFLYDHAADCITGFKQ